MRQYARGNHGGDVGLRFTRKYHADVKELHTEIVTELPVSNLTQIYYI